MKTILAVLLLAVGVYGAETNKITLTDEQLGEKLAQAITLGRVGLYDEAEATCREILAQEPDQPAVKQLLRELHEQRSKREAQDPGFALRHKLGQIVVPEVNFRAASPADVIEYLRDTSKKLSPDKTEINFVWQVPPDATLTSITLNLQKVPLTDVLDYVTQLAKLKYRIDAHAVVIYKPEPEKPIPPATEPNVRPR